MEKSRIVIGYWKARGVTEPIRKLAHYLKIDFENKTYTSMEEWAADKEKLGFEFPNLPYMIDGDKKITESDAIIVELASRSKDKNLLGKNMTETHMLVGAYKDIFRDASMLAYTCKTLESLKEETNAKFQTPRFVNFWKRIEERLSKGDYVLGDLSFLDFQLSELVEKLLILDLEVGCSILSSRPVFKSYVDRMNGLDGVKEYLASGDFIARPFNGASAVWK